MGSEMCIRDRDRSEPAPKTKRSSDAPELPPNIIFFVFTSRLPPNCGEVSSTISDNTPVKFAPLIDGRVPVIFAAGIDVKLAALAAGNVAGNLASGTVPDVRLLAFKFAKSTVSNVGSAPLFAIKNLPSLDDVP